MKEYNELGDFDNLIVFSFKKDLSKNYKINNQPLFLFGPQNFEKIVARGVYWRSNEAMEQRIEFYGDFS